MALFSIAFLDKFSILLVFLLTLLFVYAFLEKIELFGKDKKMVNALIAFVSAIIFISIPKIAALLKILLPVMGIFITIIILIFIAFNFFGVSDDDMKGFITERPELTWIILIISVIIVAVILSRLFSTNTVIDENLNIVDINDTNDPDYDMDAAREDAELKVNYKSGAFNPKILGMILIFIIGAFSVMLLAGDSNNRRSGE